MDPTELVRIKAGLVRDAISQMPSAAEAAEQAKRAAEFEQQVRKYFSRPGFPQFERLQKMRLKPVTAAWFRKQCKRWMFSTSLPPLPTVLHGEKVVSHPDYVPLERQFLLVNHD